MMRKWYLVAFGVVAVLALVWATLYIGILNQPIPRKVLAQADFGVWYPSSPTLGFSVDRASVKYSVRGADKLVTFRAPNSSNALSFTEQAIPSSINDAPQVYDKMIEKLRGYLTFDGVNGAVSLTRPEELSGGQTAVMKAKGTLVFIKPDKDLSTDDWRRLMNNLNFVH